MSINSDQRNKVIAEIPEVKHCFQCGTCTASCPSSRYMTGFNPRAIIMHCMTGSQEMLGDVLFKCITCNRCNELCPQGVNPFDVIVKLKNIAYREGKLSEEKKQELDAVLQNIKQTGSTFQITDAVQRKRAELKLAKLEFDNGDLQKLFGE